MGHMLPEKQAQLFGCVCNVKGFHPGTGISGGKQCCLPADQGRKATQLIHQTLGKFVRTALSEDIHKLGSFPAGAIQLVHRLRGLVVQSGQSGTFDAFIQTDPAQAIQDPSLRGEQIQIAGSAHKLSHQLFVHMVAHFINTVKGKDGAAFHGQLGDFHQTGTQKVLAQEHTEHGGLCGIFRRGVGQVEPGSGGIQGKKQLLPTLTAF